VPAAAFLTGPFFPFGFAVAMSLHLLPYETALSTFIFASGYALHEQNVKPKLHPW